MTFSYDKSLPAALDRIRSITGDTVAPGLRTDEEITALLALYSEPQATLYVVEGLLAEFSLQPDSVTLPGGLSVSWKERVGQLRSVAEGLQSALAVQATADSLASVTPTRADIVVTNYEYTRSEPDLWWSS